MNTIYFTWWKKPPVNSKGVGTPKKKNLLNVQILKECTRVQNIS